MQNCHPYSNRVWIPNITEIQGSLGIFGQGRMNCWLELSQWLTDCLGEAQRPKHLANTSFARSAEEVFLHTWHPHPQMQQCKKGWVTGAPPLAPKHPLKGGSKQQLLPPQAQMLASYASVQVNCPQMKLPTGL